MRPKFIVSFLLILAVFFGSLFGSQAAMAAATITVTTTADSLADDGQCSLREAVIAANTDAAVGGCLAGTGADTIQFDPSLPIPAIFSLTLTGAGEDNAATGDLDLRDTVTILGSGRDQIIVDGNGTDRVFDVLAGTVVNISGLTIRNGNPGGIDGGGGINVNLIADLTLSNTLVTENTAMFGGGIQSVGRLTMTGSTVSSNFGNGIDNFGGLATLTDVDVMNNLGYGFYNLAQAALTYSGGQVSGNAQGGIYNSVASVTLVNIKVLNNLEAGGIINVGTATSRLSMTGCLVANNISSTNGGGIKSDGSQNIVDIHDTTISSNQAASAGGGIFNIGLMSVSGSTFDNNQSRTGAGIDHFGGTLSLINDTFSGNTASDNGGGLYNRGTSTLANVTFAGNHANGAGTGNNIFNDDTAVLNFKNSIVSGADVDGNCFNNGGTIISLGHNLDSGNTCNLSAASDLTNTDPMLASLQNNGGATLTHALLTGSPAIDQGDNTGCPSIDQRGFPRPFDGNTDGTALCDIGAYEFDGLSHVTYTISGNTGVGGVDLLYTDGISRKVTSDLSGNYSFTVSDNWSGTVTPSKPGYSFVPDSRSYTNVKADQADQNYTAAPVTTSYTISGNTGVGEVDLLYIDGISKTVTSDPSGNYMLIIPADWSGTVTPSKPGYTFVPDSRTYANVMADQTAQDYTADLSGSELAVNSDGAYDGWILESRWRNGFGGPVNSTARIFRLGDNAANRQYKAILSFDTSALPDDAIINSVTLKIRSLGQPIGRNPFDVLGALLVDIRQGTFRNLALQRSDFRSQASAKNVGAFDLLPVNGWYSVSLSASGRDNINRVGVTQFRLYFAQGDNGDFSTDFMRFYSGDSLIGKPTLIIAYTLP